MKGRLIKSNFGCWSDDRGNDKLGYIFYLANRDRGFRINQESVNGKFFKENYKEMMGEIIEFSCDEWGDSVRFKKDFKEKYK